MLLTDKTAVVTGGSRGIGRAIAVALAAEGAKVAVIYAGNAAAAEETLSLIKEQGGEAVAMQCDVADDAAVSDMIRHAQIDSPGPRRPAGRSGEGRRVPRL